MIPVEPSGLSRNGLVILAAGGSSRFGSPKQLLKFRGQTLLKRAVETAWGSVCGPIAVVLGANADALLPELDRMDVTIVRNGAWERGMGSSIRAGVRALTSAHDLATITLMLCDQPLLTSQHLNLLVSACGKPENSIAASEYDGVLGVPATFDRSLFGELLALDGQEGANKIIRSAFDSVAQIPFPGGRYDIDIRESYELLLRQT